MKSRKSAGENYALSELGVGEIAEVLDIKESNPVLRKRIFDMGLTKGVIVEIKKIAPLGDPVCVSCRGYVLCLRKSELKNILARIIK